MNLQEEKEKAFQEYCDRSLFLAGSVIYKMNVIDQNRTPFNRGFDSGVKAERDRVKKVFDRFVNKELHAFDLHKELFPESGGE